jgi:hypothetical protein
MLDSAMYECFTDRLIHRGAVPAAVCLKCPYANAPLLRSRGLGDTVHKLTHAIGIDTIVQKVVGDCGCKERSEWLNNLVPYHDDGSYNRLTHTCESPVGNTAPFSGDVVRNLMMYIYPISQHEVWRWNIEQIRKRMHVFNGKRIVSVMTDHATNSVKEVQAAFCDERIDAWVVGRNDPNRWEMQGLPRMMEYVYSCDPNEITFYCHAKGVQGPEHVSGPTFLQQPRVKWATAMYGACLDDMPFVEKQLETHTFAGAFKRRMVHGEPPYRSSWHFAGTFYWFRNARLFSKPAWRNFDHQWFGAETYPGQIVGWNKAAGLFCDHPPVLYLSEAWTGQVDAMWEHWKQEHGVCTPA